jgi:hypothetical protein
MRAARSITVAVLGLACIAFPARGWTITGHSVVVDLAARHLSLGAIEKIGELLDRKLDELADISAWADDIVRERPETEPWHTVEIPHDGDGYVRERDCQNSDCIVERISDFARMLADGRASAQQRAEAVKFLIHLVGDIHVPFHAYAPGTPEDPWKGWGSWEGPWLRIDGKTSELHNWWDWHFVARLGPNRHAIAAKLAAQITASDREAWQRGSPADWANESFQIAREFVSKHRLRSRAPPQGATGDSPIVLDDTVAEEGTAIVAQRLKMAGVRLAWILNSALE